MDKSMKMFRSIAVVCIFIMIFTNTAIAALPDTAIPLAADPVYPVFRSPIQYDEVPWNSSFTFQWYAPTTGTVSHYLFSLRKLKYKDKVRDELLYGNRQVNTRTFTVAAGELDEASYYRAAVGAVLSSGSTKWTEITFYCSSSRGIQSGNTISLKISPYFTTEEKNAFYYATQTWKNALGSEKVNTYPFSTIPSTDVVDTSDGENNILIYEYASTTKMATYSRTYSGYTVEVDIIRNDYHPWTVGLSTSAYDTQDVAVHEMGHVLGLCDKYEPFSSEWTMYGQGPMNSIKRRSLHSYDIQSVKRLYGLI